MEDLNYRQWMFGLLIDCPMGKTVEDCPFNEYRDKPSTKKINIAYKIPQEKLKGLISHHKKCLAERESLIRNNHIKRVQLKK